MKKRVFLKVLSLILALLCCCGCLFACADEKDNGDEGTTDDSNKVVSSGWSIGDEASFRIVYPKNPADVVEDALEELLSAFEEKTGVRPGTSDDYIRKGKTYDISTYEILLGRTKYEQTQDVLAELGNGQYAIRVIGKKIVITAPQDADLAQAVAYFIDEYINDDMPNVDGKYMLSVSDYTSDEVVEDKTVTINGVSIEEYKIVYESSRDGYMEVANALRSTMEEKGYKVSVESDRINAGATGEKAILIGNTNRSLSQRIYSENPPEPLTYKLVIDGDYLQIVSGGPFSAKNCIGDMSFNFFNATDRAFKNGVYMDTDMRSAKNAFAENTDVRMMTVNLLAERFAAGYEEACPPIEQRAEIFAAMLIGSTPDVIGLQECDKAWVKPINYYLTYIKDNYNIEYEWIFEDWISPIQTQAGMTDGETLNSIMYRSDKYEAKASGAENVDWWTRTDYNIRNFEWVYLTEKSNSAHEFIFTNTHWAQIDASTTQELVDGSVNLSINGVNSLKSRYPGVPIFSAGDYNSAENRGSDYELDFLVDTESFDAMLKAVENGVRVNECDGCAAISSPRITSRWYIDHIACTGSNTLDVLKYETLVGYNIYLSDHLPHIADMKVW